MKTKGSILRIAAAALLVLCCLGAAALASRQPEFITESFAPLSRGVCGAVGAAFSLFPFSFAELSLVGLIIFILASLVVFIIRRFRGFLRWFSWVALFASVLGAMFTFFWGLNYYGLPLARSLDLEVTEYTADQLYEAAEFYLEKANEYSYLVQRNQDDTASLGSFEALAKDCGAGYGALSETYPVFSGIYSPPKKVTLSAIMSRTHITGIFCPMTAECNVNPTIPAASLPFTMEHELAHRLAVCPENEANFAAFLACRESGIPEFQYSGYYSALVYLNNALARVDRERQSKLWDQMSPGVLADINASIAHYRAYEGRVSQTAEKVNNAYLKAMSQESGTASYGQVVDLLIAEYLRGS